MERKAFLDQEPPPGYIPGVGRGAVGFSTTSTDSFNRGIEVLENDQEKDDDNFDGEDIKALFNSRKQTEEDEEADRIYQQIEDKLRSRRKQGVINDPKSLTIPTSNTKFNDLKRDLANLTEEEWSMIPEPGDMTRKNKRQRLLEQQQQRTYALPDTMISNLGSTVSESNNRLLSSHLDNLLPQNNNQLDPSIQESILSMSGVEQDSKIADLKKGRVIFSSLRKTEPYKASSWISSAKLEESFHNFNLAKKYIQQGCDKIPRNENIWLENIRMNQSDRLLCLKLVKQSLVYNKKSEKLWLKSFDLESDRAMKKRVLMKGLEEIPNNVTLWKRLIEIEDDLDMVRKLLSKATELCFKEWEFWLALINLSSYKDSKAILNKVRKIIIGDLRVWITGCKIEERENPDIDQAKLNRLFEKGLKEANTFEKKEIFQCSIEAKEEGFNKTSEAILRAFLQTQNDNIDDLLQDVDEQPNYISNLILQYIVDAKSDAIDIWKKIFKSLKDANELEKLYDYYEKAIKSNPRTMILYLMYAKDKWKVSNDVVKARDILSTFDDVIELNLAKLKLDWDTKNYKSAKQYAETLTIDSPRQCDKYWYKYIHILRCLKEPTDNILKISEQALKIFPQNWKLHLQRIQVLRESDVEKAKDAASLATKVCPECPQIWSIYSSIFEKLNITIKARSILDQALLFNPKSIQVISEKIQFEIRNKDFVSVRQLVNKYLKLYPNSDVLWLISLRLINKMSQRKNLFLDALKSTDNSSIILLFIGITFWKDGKFAKSQTWFERALTSTPSNGDCWSWMYNYSKKFMTQEQTDKLIRDYEDKFEIINQGEEFLKVKKNINNFDKSPIELLHITSEYLLTI